MYRVLSQIIYVVTKQIGFFSGHLSTGTDLIISFDLVKCVVKININSYPNYNGKVEGGRSPER